MNTNLLREWFHLPPGPWPPTDRELIGLPATGEFDASVVEIKALERMDELRPRQLVHPELVTEGMNRLAQALIALTATVQVAPTPHKKHKKVNKEVTPVEIRKPSQDVRLDFENAQSIKPPSAPQVILPAILEAEVIDPSAGMAEVIPESYAVQADEPAIPVLDEPINIPEPPPGTVVTPSPRRLGYREIVRLRQFQNAWAQFRPLLGDPSERLLTPAKIAAYLDAIAALREALKKNIDRSIVFPDMAGHAVVSAVCHPVPLSLIRDFVPSQRRIIARDWAVAEAELEAKSNRMRRMMNASRKKRTLNKFIHRTRKVLIQNPEWILLLILSIAIVIGFRRSS